MSASRASCPAAEGPVLSEGLGRTSQRFQPGPMEALLHGDGRWLRTRREVEDVHKVGGKRLPTKCHSVGEQAGSHASAHAGWPDILARPIDADLEAKVLQFSADNKQALKVVVRLGG